MSRQVSLNDVFNAFRNSCTGEHINGGENLLVTPPPLPGKIFAAFPCASSFL